MPLGHNRNRTRKAVLRASIVGSWLGLMIALGSAAIVYADATPPAGSEATPVSEAMVDDVMVSLISWSLPTGGGTFEARVILANHGDSPVSVLDSVVLVTRTAQGTTDSYPVELSPGPECQVSPGQQVAFTLRQDLDPGVTPERLIIGLVEVNRQGGRVEFPLNGDGASAFGGSGAPGGNAGEGTAAAGTAIASPAGATPVGSPPACSQH